jgi:serine/threonine protein phosphatase 1
LGQEDSEQLLLQIIDDKEWMERLPSHIVLDKWRLVHAGYDPRKELDSQEEDTLLWIRKPFHNATKPVDEERTVLFGHTPTMNLNKHLGAGKWGKPWYSKVELNDGRPASIGLDTCLFHEERQPATLTAFNLQTQEVLHVNRVERWDGKIREQVKEV